MISLPAPGTVTRLDFPSGPGVRIDAGMETGTVIGGQFDSMLAKVIVTGADRDQAIERSRRALDEMVAEGIATVLPFHRTILRDPAFVGDGKNFSVHTRWIETEFDNTIEPYVAPDAAADADEEPRQNVVVEVGGRRLEVSLPGNLASAGGGGGAATKSKPRKRTGGGKTAVSGDAVTAPMQGTVIKVAVEDGQHVEAGEQIVVLEAMKMENPVTAHKSGTVTGLSAETGTTVNQGAVLLEIKD